MDKKLTISIDERVYAALHEKIGRGNISRFIERVASERLSMDMLAEAYRDMAEYEKTNPYDNDFPEHNDPSHPNYIDLSKQPPHSAE